MITILIIISKNPFLLDSDESDSDDDYDSSSEEESDDEDAEHLDLNMCPPGCRSSNTISKFIVLSFILRLTYIIHIFINNILILV